MEGMGGALGRDKAKSSQLPREKHAKFERRIDEGDAVAVPSTINIPSHSAANAFGKASTIFIVSTLT